MIDSTSVAVRVTRPFSVSVDRVCDAWLDAKIAAKWLFATPTGEMVRAEIDPRVGGALTMVDRRNGEDVEHAGEFIEIDRPRRIVLDWWVPKFSPVRTRMTIEIVPLEIGCELRVINEPVATEFAERTQRGWSKLLDGLAVTLGSV